MKRILFTCAIVALLITVSFGGAQSAAAQSEYLVMTYPGGAICTSTFIFMPFYIESYLDAPTPFSETGYVNGVAVYSLNGVQSAGFSSYLGNVPFGFAPPEEFPYTFQVIADFNGKFVVTINGVCYGEGQEPVVSFADSVAEGRSPDASFELRYITCTTGLYDMPAGKQLETGEFVKEGQTWFVNPTPVKGADGRSWTEIFVSGARNAYLPTACVG
ncbi:MAG TPA: hypothetical protein PLD47_15060 [Aggregatilineales bacterium]|nr:hypothetical protein [Anaerolineales bacterium]HRE49046.1 hypothetical protein [Aggregatilineales bacterium]